MHRIAHKKMVRLISGPKNPYIWWSIPSVPVNLHQPLGFEYYTPCGCPEPNNIIPRWSSKQILKNCTQIAQNCTQKNSPPHQRTKKPLYMVVFTFRASKSGAPAGIRTLNLLIRRTAVWNLCRICGGLELID